MIGGLDMDEPVLSASQWHELWDIRLDTRTRRHITRAVRRGELLDVPDEAAIAAELAIRWMRRLRTLVVLNVVSGVVLGVCLVAIERPSASRPWSYWFTLSLSGVSLLSPLVAAWQRRRLYRGRTANLALSAGSAHSAASDDELFSTGEPWSLG